MKHKKGNNSNKIYTITYLLFQIKILLQFITKALKIFSKTKDKMLKNSMNQGSKRFLNQIFKPFFNQGSKKSFNQGSKTFLNQRSKRSLNPGSKWFPNQWSKKLLNQGSKKVSKSRIQKI